MVLYEIDIEYLHDMRVDFITDSVPCGLNEFVAYFWLDQGNNLLCLFQLEPLDWPGDAQLDDLGYDRAEVVQRGVRQGNGRGSVRAFLRESVQQEVDVAETMMEGVQSW